MESPQTSAFDTPPPLRTSYMDDILATRNLLQNEKILLLAWNIAGQRSAL